MLTADGYPEEKAERRRHKRYKLKDGLYAVLWPIANVLGEVLDISQGGLCFRYIDLERPGKMSSTLDIFSVDGNIHMRRIPFRIISDDDVLSEYPKAAVKVRKCRIQFGEFTKQMSSQLVQLISRYGSE